MNWKLGFFRIWIVASICWVSFVGWLFYNATVVSRRITATQQACVDDRRADPSLGNVFDCFDKGIRFDDLTTFGSVVAKYLRNRRRSDVRRIGTLVCSRLDRGGL